MRLVIDYQPGTPWQVIDAETGREIAGITSIELRARAGFRPVLIIERLAEPWTWSTEGGMVLEAQTYRVAAMAVTVEPEP